MTITVNRSTKQKGLTPMWIITSDLFPVKGNLPVAATSNVANAIDRTLATTVPMSASANTFLFDLNTGSSLYGCDQLAFYGDIAGRSPVQMTLKGEGITEVPTFSVSMEKMLENGDASKFYFTIPHDRQYPTTSIKLGGSSATGTMTIREFLPLGGTRQYKRVYYSSADNAYYLNIHGRLPYTLSQTEMAHTEMILPSLPHTLVQIDENNWQATLNSPALGAKRTSFEQYDPGALAYNSMTAISALNGTYPGKMAGNYWFNIAGVPVPFMSFTQGDNWFMAATTFPDGRVAAMTSSPVVYEGMSRILPANVLANVPVTSVRISNAFSLYNETIDSSHATVISRFKAYQELTQLKGDDAMWIRLNGSMQFGNMICDPGNYPLNERVYHSCGNVSGLHFIPTATSVKTNNSTGAAVQMNVWWKVV